MPSVRVSNGASAPVGGTTASDRVLASRIILASVVLVGIFSFGWRPWALGFYSDDYALFVEPLAAGSPPAEVVAKIYKSAVFKNRPVAGWCASVLVPLCKDDPFRWQVILACQAMVISVLVGWIVLGLFRLEQNIDLPSAALICSLWPLLPVTFGFLAWPTCATVNLCLAAFLLFWGLLLTSWRFRVPVALGFLGLGFLTYEQFYFQIIPVLFFLFWKRKSLGYGKSELGFLVCSSLLIQILAVVFNRLVLDAPRKVFDPEFILTRVWNVLTHPEYLHYAIIPLAAVLFGLWLAFRSVKAAKGDGPRLEHSPLVLLPLMGIAISGLVCLVAGYSVRPFGIGSRTTMAVSVWMVVLAFGAALQIQSLGWRRTFLAGLSAVCLVLNLWQGRQWAGSWKEQQRVVGNAPVDLFKDLPPGSTVISLVPNYYGEVIVFDEDWTLGPALRTRHPELRGKGIAFIPHKNTGFTKADLRYENGKVFRETRHSGHRLEPLPVTEVYFWNSYTRDLLKVAAPWALPADLKIKGKI